MRATPAISNRNHRLAIPAMRSVAVGQTGKRNALPREQERT